MKNYYFKNYYFLVIFSFFFLRVNTEDTIFEDLNFKLESEIKEESATDENYLPNFFNEKKSLWTKLISENKNTCSCCNKEI